MLGSYVSAAYQSAPTPEVERFYTGLLEWAGVELPVKTSDSGIEVRTLEAGPDTLLFVFRHGKTPTEAIIDVRTAARTAFDLVAQKLVPAGRAGDMLRLRKHVEPSEVWVVRLSPQ